jgi:hypothetical protein
LLSGNPSTCEYITGIVLFTIIAPFYVIYNGAKEICYNIGIIERPFYMSSDTLDPLAEEIPINLAPESIIEKPTNLEEVPSTVTEPAFSY